MNSRKPKLMTPSTPSTRAPNSGGRKRRRATTAMVHRRAPAIHSSSEPSCAPQSAVDAIEQRQRRIGILGHIAHREVVSTKACTSTPAASARNTNWPRRGRGRRGKPALALERRPCQAEERLRRGQQHRQDQRVVTQFDDHQRASLAASGAASARPRAACTSHRAWRALHRRRRCRGIEPAVRHHARAFAKQVRQHLVVAHRYAVPKSVTTKLTSSDPGRALAGCPSRPCRRARKRLPGCDLTGRDLAGVEIEHDVLLEGAQRQRAGEPTPATMPSTQIQPAPTRRHEPLRARRGSMRRRASRCACAASGAPRRC